MIGTKKQFHIPTMPDAVGRQLLEAESPVAVQHLQGQEDSEKLPAMSHGSDQ